MSSLIELIHALVAALVIEIARTVIKRQFRDRWGG